MAHELVVKLLETSSYVQDKVVCHKKATRLEAEKRGETIEVVKLTLVGKNTLRILLEYEEINQRNLAKLQNISPQVMSITIKKLEENEFIVKRHNKTNNENMISITPLGRERVAYFVDLLDAVSENILSNLSKKDRDKLMELLSKIN